MKLCGLLAGLALLTAAGASAQDVNLCADCHLSRPNLPGEAHVQMWDRSAHARGAPCASCHGGDPRASVESRAHRDIIRPGNAKSPLNTRNIAGTCGTCHVGQYVAFQDSRHYQLLQTGSTKGPTCVTCHGDVDGWLLSPKALESQCNQCHGPREEAPRAARAKDARALYAGLAVVRSELKIADSLIKRVDDRQRRDELTAAYREAQVPVTLAIVAGHKFVYDDLRVSVAQAQSRVSALLSRLANEGTARR